MKYSIQAKCEKQYLQKADEIIIQHKEIARLEEYMEEFKDKQFTIHCYDCKSEDIDWGYLKKMQSVYSNTFTIGVNVFSDISRAKEWGFNAYMLKFINNYAELATLKEAGACYVYLDQPLFSSLDKVKRFGIPVRWMPNLVDASPGYLSRPLHGTWIRPEDIDEYDIIDGCICEFVSHNGIVGEQAAFRVYSEQKAWPFDIGLLMPEFEGQNAKSFLIDPKLVEYRKNCHQRCEEFPNGSGCRICENAFHLANIDLIQEYLNEKMPSED